MPTSAPRHERLADGADHEPPPLVGHRPARIGRPSAAAEIQLAIRAVPVYDQHCALPWTRVGMAGLQAAQYIARPDQVCVPSSFLDHVGRSVAGNEGSSMDYGRVRPLRPQPFAGLHYTPPTSLASTGLAEARGVLGCRLNAELRQDPTPSCSGRQGRRSRLRVHCGERFAAMMPLRSLEPRCCQRVLVGDLVDRRGCWSRTGSGRNNVT